MWRVSPRSRDSRSERTQRAFPRPSCSWAHGKYRLWQSWYLSSECTSGSTDCQTRAMSKGGYLTRPKKGKEKP